MIVLILLFSASCVFRASGAASESAKTPEEELRSAIDSTKTGAAKKVAMMRLKRALASAKQAQGVPEALIAEAERALTDSSEAEGRRIHAQGALQKALDARDFSMLEEAVKNAKKVGLVKSDDFVKAEEALAQLQKDRKKEEKRKAKQLKLRRDLTDMVALDASKVNATDFQNALSLAREQLSQEDRELLNQAQTKLEAVQWFAMPLAARLDSTSTEYGMEACRPLVKPPPMMCRRYTDHELLDNSRKIGDANCDHSSLRPGGETPPLPNALPAETSRNFCKYPPSFDLQHAEDGEGYRVKEFEFPHKLFNTSAMQRDDFSDLAVINLDMGLFRNGIATCGELWLIEFYVHWCPHCMALMPKFYKLAMSLRSSGKKLRVGAVNCAVQRDLCGAFKVMGHPLLAFFYAGEVAPGGSVQLFEYSGQDVRVNSVLDYIKANRDPAWDAGAPADYEPPKHLFPGEAALDLIRLLPEEYRPTDAVLRWIGNSSRASGSVCPEARRWYSREESESDASNSSDIPAAVAKKPTKFPGSGWPLFEVVLTPTQRLHDAAQAIVYSLEEWVVPNAAGRSPHAFAYQELSDLHDWLSLLASLFPSVDEGGLDLRQALLELKELVRTRIQKIEDANGHAVLCHNEWQTYVKIVRRALDAVRAKQVLPPSCRTETCRMWTLLHVLTVANLARSREGQVAVSSDALVNSFIFDTLASFLRRYFTCQACRKHFLEEVAAESFGLAAARIGGPKDLALWWWRLHRAVSLRVAKEGKCKADRQWPAADVCKGCWANSTNDGVKAFRTDPDEDLVAQELIRQYWPKPPLAVKEQESADM